MRGRFSRQAILLFKGEAQAHLEVGFVDKSIETHLEMRLLGLGLQRGFLTSWLGERGSC